MVDFARYGTRLDLSDAGQRLDDDLDFSSSGTRLDFSGAGQRLPAVSEPPALPPSDPEQSRLSSAFSSFAQGLGQTVSGLPKSIALLGAPDARVLKNLERIDQGKMYIPNPMPMGSYGPATDLYAPFYDEYTKASPEERQRLRQELYQEVDDALASPLYETGRQVDQWFAENFPTNPEYQQEFWSSLVPQALGSATGFVAAGVATRGMAAPLGPAAMQASAYVAPAALGSAMNRAQQFEDALESGADMATALQASEIGAIIGMTEAIPIGNLFNRLDRGSGGQVKRYVTRAIQQGTEEAVQEAFAGIMNDAVAQNLYDPERGVWTGDRLEEGAVGFTTGAILETLMTLALPGRRRGGAQTQPEGDTSGVDIPEGAVPADTLYGAVQDSGPEGVRQRARATVPEPSQDDIASPLDTQTIVEGRAILQDAEGAVQANRLLEAAGIPPIDSRVVLTTRNGGATAGTVVDAFESEGQQGAKIRLDSGSVVSETFEQLRGRISAEPAPDLAPAPQATEAQQNDVPVRDGGAGSGQAAATPAPDFAAGGTAVDGSAAQPRPDSPRTPAPSDGTGVPDAGLPAAADPALITREQDVGSIGEGFTVETALSEAGATIWSARHGEAVGVYRNNEGGVRPILRHMQSGELFIREGGQIVPYKDGDYAEYAYGNLDQLLEWRRRNEIPAADQAAASELTPELQALSDRFPQDGPVISTDDGILVRGPNQQTINRYGSNAKPYSARIPGIPSAFYGDTADEARREAQEHQSQPAVPASLQASAQQGAERKRVSDLPLRQPITRREVQQAEDTAVTASGREVPVRYAVVEADDLIASQMPDGRTNPDYPAELQPRDRTRAVSRQQIQDISQRLNPRLLDRSPRAADGAPIIAEDGVVESGNGRTLALRQAYEQNLEGAQQYRDYLQQQGYNIEGMNRPVLVRIRDGELETAERQAFTREANERDTLGMSATERAMADATALADNLLELYRGGDVDSAANRPFVRAFIESVVGRNEQAGMIAADGAMSQEAIRRVEGALLGKAYSDTNLVANLIESADTNIRAIGGALMDVAAGWAQMRAEAADGTIDPAMDQTERLLEAVRLVQRARRDGRNVAEFVGQTDMLSGDALHPVAEAFLRLMFRNTQNWTQPAGREKLATALRFYLEAANRAQPGVDLLGESAPAPGRILDTAKERQYAEERQAGQQQDLLAQPARSPGRSDGEVRAEREQQPAQSPAQPRSEEAARAGSEGTSTEAVAPTTAADVRIEDFTEKSIIVRGVSKEEGESLFADLKAKPLWNAKEQAWVFSKKREDEVRAALADLLGEQPAAPAVTQPSKPAQPTGPRIIVNELNMAEERARQEAEDSNRAGRSIGTNARGNPLFEDERGVRSYSENGIMVTESVGIIPGRGISIDIDARGNDFLTEDERAARQSESRTEASQSVTLQAQEETDDGIQGSVPAGDAGSGAADVQPAAQDRRPGLAPAAEGSRSPADVRGTDRERAQTAERPGGAAAPQGSRAERAGDPDRVPAGRAERAERPAAEAARVKGDNYRIEPGALQETRGRTQKARDNIRAIELMRQIEAEGRTATAAEQEQLARYVGWGGLKGAFPDSQGNFEKGLEAVGKQLQVLLSEAEYATARRSLQYAHYTAENVARAMWQAAERLGFAGGKVFEPGMGIGNFPGLMPADVATRTDYHGLELDHTTARMARLLYPRWGVRQDDFTKAPLPKDTYDLVIGNPPFADIPIKSDAAYPQGFLLHDYFFAKSLDAVRPGGLLAFISSAGTMNKMDASAREYLAERADLVGAIRLPGNAFEQSAGTSVTTDIIFLRKRLPGEAAGDRAWTETTEVTLPNKEGKPTRGRVSRYFVDNPDMVLGEEGFFDPLYEGRYGVRAPKDYDLDSALRQALGRLPENVMSAWQDTTERAEIDFGSAERKEGSFYLGRDGALMQQRDGVGRPVEKRGAGVQGGRTLAEMERIKALIPMRDALRAVYAADLAGDTANAQTARARLNTAYDAFVSRFGPVNKAEFQYRRPTIIQQESARAEAREEARYAGSTWNEGSFDPSSLIEQGASLQQIARARADAREAAEKAGRTFDEGTFDPTDMPDLVIEKRPNIDPFLDDPENYRLRAIEDYNDQSGEAKKTEVFFRNIITRERAPSISSINDALLYALNQRGRVDIPEIARLAGVSESQAIEQLGAGIYQVPGTTDQWVTRDEYLSGNVRRKLRQARAAAERDPALQRNVDALEAAQPAPLPPSEINANLGMPWIPTQVIEQFGMEALGLQRLTVRYTAALGQWDVAGDTDSAAARATWGTADRSAPALVQDALNRQDPRVYREVYVDGKKTRELDPVATEAAQEKVREIKQRFADWVWSDPARARELAGLYNEDYNNLVVREYDGEYLTTPGISATWGWRPHQTRVIARIIQSGNTYMAHSVGAGKTSAMIGAGMEMRRLGLVRKPMYIVPNHMLGQFTKEFYEQYPTARIAVADERRFHTDRRKQFIANVATEDLDAVIITHSAFGMIPISDTFQDGLIQEQIDQYRELLAEVGKDQESRITRSRLEKQIERLEQRLTGKASKRRDQVFTFEEMGADFLFVDEAHEFRKLDFATKMSNVKGISPEGSKASWDLYVKTRYLETVNPGRNLVLASGTPVTNTMAELFTVSRYLQPQELRDRGLEHFDSWAGAFGDTVTNLEQNPAGGYQPVTRFAKFVNVPELSAMVRQSMDVVTGRQLEQYVTRPQLKGGKRQMNLAEKSEALEAYQLELANRMTAIANRKGPPQPGDDIILSVINDGRHAAIDMRLVDPELPNDPGSKLNLLVDNVFRIWEQTKRQAFHQPEQGGFSAKPIDKGPAAQMVFANLGLSGSRGFAVPDYIRSELQRRGVPKNQIALIGDYKTHVAKQRLFNDINEGKVRVLIGSTGKMATGVNAQRRLYALHNLDPLWYPADDEQRNGRIIRQGNLNPEIEIHDYSTKGTYDSTMWGMMETKARFIQGFFEGDPTLRDMEDLGEASQYEQAKAMTTADPRLIELTDLRQQLERANRRKVAFEREQYATERRVAESTDRVRHYTKRIAGIEGDIARRTDTSGENFRAVLEGKTYTDRVEFGDTLLGRIDLMKGEAKEYKDQKLGAIGGFDILADVWGNAKDRQASLVVAREGGFETEVRVSGSARGVVQALEGVLRGFEGDLADVQARLKSAENTIKEFTPQLGKQFTGQAEIDKLTAEVRSLERELAPKQEDKPAPKAETEGQFQMAYNGSPYLFDSFSLDAIGSGQGDLAYGWGLYFAGERAVAEYYRDMAVGNANDLFENYEQLSPKAQEIYFEYSEQLEDNPDVANEFRQKMEEVGYTFDFDMYGEPTGLRPLKAGNIYDVDIPENSELLNWDAPLSQQPDQVKAALRPVMDRLQAVVDRRNRQREGRGLTVDNLSGKDIYYAITPDATNQRDASMALNELGIPGLRYLDAASRKAGKGTNNYVIWDENRITIEAVNDQIRQAERRKYALSNDFAAKAETVTQDLAGRLEKLGIADKVALNLRERIQAVVDGKASEADGRYLNRTIEVSLAARDGTGALNHEVIHALRDMGLFRAAEWRTLERAALADTQQMQTIRERYARLNLSEELLIEEAIAEMYTGWAVGRSQTGGFVRSAFQRVRDFLKALGNALRGNGFRTAESVFGAVERGAVGRRQAATDTAGAERFAARGAKTETAAFKRWFGKSKVVDAGGRPLVVYHGARPGTDITEFFTDPDGAYFTPDPQYAEGFTSELFDKPDRQGAIYPAYLSIQNAYMVETEPSSEDWDNFVDRGLNKKELEAAGYDGAILRDRTSGEIDQIIAFRPEQIKSAVGNVGTFDPNNADIRYSVKDPGERFALSKDDPTAKGSIEDRQKAAGQWYGSQPLDHAFRLPFNLFGGINARGEWNWGQKLNAKTASLITSATFNEDGRFAWMNGTLEKARAGLLDRYGLDAAYVERERQRGLDERRIMAKVPEIMQRLKDASMGSDEAKVLQAVLTGEAVADADMAKLAEPIRNAIDDMGAEAVELGLISAEAFERNRGAYLHRVYLKNESDQGGLVRWVSRMSTQRRRKIIGNQFKGRGLWIEVGMDKLTANLPGFKEAARGAPVKGERFQVLDRVEGEGQGTLRGIDPGSRRRTLDRVFLPEGQAIPEKYAGYQERGVWEVRGMQGGKPVLWRDFTKAERERMGEITDARYTIAKTYMQMAHDLSTGRFFQDIALNEDWSTGIEPRSATWKDAAEYNRFWSDADVEWVKVPDTNIPKSQTKRYGALAGRWVRAEIWRDLAEMESLNKAGLWNTVLTQWKLNKTARSPVVHMNNVMSNLVLMDLADVRMADLVRGIHAMATNSAEYQEAVDNGAFGSDMVAQEIRKNTLQPLLEEIQRDMQGGKESMEAKIGVLGKLADAIWSKGKNLDRKLTSLYQIEDEVFRMATYLRKRSLGINPTESALQARDQFLNYDIRAPWVNAARRSVLPFLSYTYRAVPVVAQSVMLRPWKLAKYVTVAYAANALAYMIAGGDEEEERRSLNKNEQGNTWIGAPRMIRMPYSDDYGNPVFLDVRRWIPAGDVFDMNQGNGAFPIPAPLQFGGPLMLGAELALNKQAFTGREITNDRTDDWWDKSSKIGDWAWKSWMPSAAWVPGSWYWQRLGNAATGARDAQGRPYSLGSAIPSAFGVKLKPQDVQEAFMWKGIEFDRIERELRAEMRSLGRDYDRGMLSRSAYEKRQARVLDKLENLGRERERTFVGER